MSERTKDVYNIFVNSFFIGGNCYYYLENDIFPSSHLLIFYILNKYSKSRLYFLFSIIMSRFSSTSSDKHFLEQLLQNSLKLLIEIVL